MQDSLTKQRESWKKKKEEIKESQSAVMSLGEHAEGMDSIRNQKNLLKEEGDHLNKRAMQLNELVHQIRRTQVMHQLTVI